MPKRHKQEHEHQQRESRRSAPRIFEFDRSGSRGSECAVEPFYDRRRSSRRVDDRYVIEARHPDRLDRVALREVAVGLAEFDLLHARQMSRKRGGRVLDRLLRIALGKNEQRILRTLGTECPAARNHYRAFDAGIVGRVVERGARAHRMPHHDDSRSIYQLIVAKIIDRSLHVRAQAVALSRAAIERISILAVPVYVDRQDSVTVLRQSSCEPAHQHAIAGEAVNQHYSRRPLRNWFGKQRYRTDLPAPADTSSPAPDRAASRTHAAARHSPAAPTAQPRQ